MRSQWAIGACVALCARRLCAQSTSTIGGLSGSHTDIPRWCGKPYEPGSPNFDPGGQIEPPKPSASPLLDLQVLPHHSIYDSSEKIASFIVNAAISHTHGQAFTNISTWPRSYQHRHPGALSIEITTGNATLVSGIVPLNTTGNILDFSPGALIPSLDPYQVILTASLSHPGEQQTFSASTELYYLPAKNTGSTVKIDNLRGGMLVANNATQYSFEPFLPFGFYASCSGYLNYSLANVTAYKDLGFNAINPVCAFTDGDLGFLFDWLDQANLWYQYDMRSNYQNLTEVSQQVALLKDHSNLLSWYTADEPDGWEYALNSTRITYDLLKEEDPYHPTGLVLNCQDYYFREYTSGTDYIMEDAYPVGIDPTYSRKFNTTVNATYGDCGCDNCIGSLTDVSDRLDNFIEYQEWLGGKQKPLWAVLQVFSGEEYWSRDPTPSESWVMMILSFNHKAKAMMSWDFPTTNVLEKAYGEMSKVLTAPSVSRFLLGSDPVAIPVQSYPQLDVAYWQVDDQFMVAFGNVGNTTTNGTIHIQLPSNVSKIDGQPWGSLSWSLNRGGQLSSYGVDGLATSILLLS